MASSKATLRSTLSFPNLVLSSMNFTLFILSAASVAPVILLRTPPTSMGLAFLMVSSISLFSSLVGFYSQLTHFCFITHISLLLASLVGQLLSVLALFTKENSTLSLLKSRRDPREAKLLARLECGVLMAMFLMQIVVFVLSCAVQSCWLREYEGLGAEREAAEKKKRNRRMAKVQEEPVVKAEKIVEVKAEDEMKSKYGQWVKTDFEG